jgi:histidyl-tRNA synthetase
MSIAAVRGFRDALPAVARLLTRIERDAAEVLERYGFDEIRLPIVERTELFARSIGETTDIIEKEMYTFPDRDGTLLSLRPEGTASLVRAFVEHHLDQRDQVARLYYVGPMFRHERPQKGRHRQFYQVGAELIGREDALADAELLVCLADVMERLGIHEAAIALGTLGDETCRPAYRELLRAFGEAHRDELCENCRRRLEKNPLRILDCKEPGCRAATEDAPEARRPSVRAVRRALRAGARAARRAGRALRDRPAPGARSRLLRPHHVRGHGAGTGLAEPRWVRAVATTV